VTRAAVRAALVAALALLTATSTASCGGARADASMPSASERPSDPRFAPIFDWAREVHSPAGTILVDGQTLYSWGDVTRKMSIHSCRKSLLSALVGVAVARGNVDLSATLDNLGIDDHPPVLTPDERQATVRDLLEARSGVYHEAAYETDSMKRHRPSRGSHPHGTHWYYNNWDFNALGGIYEQATKRSIFDAFEAEIARPIGMEDYSAADGAYSRSRVSRFPAYLFSMSTRDLARFGQLYLQHGAWKGTQVVPEGWIAESTTAYSEPKRLQGGGYGYLWWTGGRGTGLFPDVDLGPGAYAAEGHGGHYVVVVPRHHLVVVSRADDAWFDVDPSERNITGQREGKLMKLVLRAVGGG
jgi:CubicO group peptidase (beta-lactamase class C family)